MTGATGRVGGQVAAQLADAGARVRAVARRPAPGVVAGDLTRPETLEHALSGVDAAFLVFPSVAGDAAAATLVEVLTAAVPHVVYLSAFGVPDVPDPEAAPDGTILGSHAHVEGLLAAAPGTATFLRASGFAANTLGWAAQIRAGDVLRWSTRTRAGRSCTRPTSPPSQCAACSVTCPRGVGTTSRGRSSSARSSSWRRSEPRSAGRSGCLGLTAARPASGSPPLGPPRAHRRSAPSRGQARRGQARRHSPIGRRPHTSGAGVVSGAGGPQVRASAAW